MKTKILVVLLIAIICEYLGGALCAARPDHHTRIMENADGEVIVQSLDDIPFGLRGLTAYAWTFDLWQSNAEVMDFYDALLREDEEKIKAYRFPGDLNQDVFHEALVHVRELDVSDLVIEPRVVRGLNVEGYDRAFLIAGYYVDADGPPGTRVIKAAFDHLWIADGDEWYVVDRAWQKLEFEKLTVEDSRGSGPSIKLTLEELHDPERIEEVLKQLEEAAAKARKERESDVQTLEPK